MTSLASYAVNSDRSRGREYPEAADPWRNPFQLDRDRIVLSGAFRRLEGKTQVFTPGRNDHYRSRLTHTIEVAQTGRTLARVLGLNEALTEAVCLGHDIGHSPFGHTGEKVLNRLMADHGGFEHNHQTLRLVEYLEKPFTDFAGLNLTWETRRGLAKHNNANDSPPLEGQIADLADRITYNTHDLEDGIRARLIEESRVTGLDLLDEARTIINADDIKDFVIRRTQLSRTILSLLMTDAIETSRDNLRRHNIRTLEDVTRYPAPLIALSEKADKKLKQLETFLRQSMYNHSDLTSFDRDVESWLTRLFNEIRENPSRMPTYFNNMIRKQGLERTVCDYIAGMTDRFAMQTITK